MGEALYKLAFVRDVMALAMIGAESNRSDGWAQVSKEAWNGLDIVLGGIVEELKAA